MTRSTESVATVVIGAGQSGLATARELRALGVDCVVLDGADAVGRSWRDRWDSLRLFTPAHFTHLPGMRFPADRSHLPSKDEMADYLQAYASRYELPVRHGWRVDRLGREGTEYEVCSAGRAIRARAVVIATGPAMTPRVPAFAPELDPAVTAVHAARYRNPGRLPEGTVLVVGAGNSGAEIAMDLAPTHAVVLAGRDTGRFPFRIGGPLYLLMNRLLTVSTPPGRAIATRGGKGTPLVRVREQDLSAAGVERAPRMVGVRDGRPLLDDGRAVDAAAVVWCTGYAPDYSWVDLPGFPAAAPPPHERGVVSGHPGLYFVGLPFQSRMASSLVGGVGQDARYISGRIKNDRC